MLHLRSLADRPFLKILFIKAFSNFAEMAIAAGIENVTFFQVHTPSRSFCQMEVLAKSQKHGHKFCATIENHVTFCDVSIEKADLARGRGRLVTRARAGLVTLETVVLRAMGK